MQRALVEHDLELRVTRAIDFGGACAMASASSTRVLPLDPQAERPGDLSGAIQIWRKLGSQSAM